MLNKIGPSIDPWGTPKSISSQELWAWFILVLCFLSEKVLCFLSYLWLEYISNVAINISEVNEAQS